MTRSERHQRAFPPPSGRHRSGVTAPTPLSELATTSPTAARSAHRPRYAPVGYDHGASEGQYRVTEGLADGSLFLAEELFSPSRSEERLTAEMEESQRVVIPPGRHHIKRHACCICLKLFSRPSALKAHMSVHTGTKPHLCPELQCGRRFSVSSNMKRHMRIHASAHASPIFDKLQISAPELPFQSQGTFGAGSAPSTPRENHTSMLAMPSTYLIGLSRVHTPASHTESPHIESPASHHLYPHFLARSREHSPTSALNVGAHRQSPGADNYMPSWLIGYPIPRYPPGTSYPTCHQPTPQAGWRRLVVPDQIGRPPTAVKIEEQPRSRPSTPWSPTPPHSPSSPSNSPLLAFYPLLTREPLTRSSSNATSRLAPGVNFLSEPATARAAQDPLRACSVVRSRGHLREILGRG